MNINYAEIIKRANDRKDALVHLGGLLEELPDQARALRSTLLYFERLAEAEAALDIEARTLVKELCGAMRQVTYPLGQAKTAMEYVCPGYVTPALDRFIQSAKGKA